MSPNATLQPSIPLSCPGLPPSPRPWRAEHPPEPRRSLGGVGTGASSTPRLGPLNHNGLGVLDRPVKPGDDTERVGARSPNLAQLSHFATLFPLALSFGTTLERIAAESLTTAEVLFRSRHMSRDSYWLCTRWSFALPHKRRFDDWFLKIGDGAESNQNRAGVKWIPGSRPPNSLPRKQPHAQ